MIVYLLVACQVCPAAVYTALIVDGGSNLNKLMSHVYSAKFFRFLLIEHPKGTTEQEFSQLKSGDFLSKGGSKVVSVKSSSAHIGTVGYTNAFLPWSFKAHFGFNKNELAVADVNNADQSVNCNIDQLGEPKGGCSFNLPSNGITKAAGLSAKLQLGNLAYNMNENIFFVATFTCNSEPKHKFGVVSKGWTTGKVWTSDEVTAYVAIDCHGFFDDTKKAIKIPLLATQTDKKSLQTTLNKRFREMDTNYELMVTHTTPSQKILNTNPVFANPGWIGSYDLYTLYTPKDIEKQTIKSVNSFEKANTNKIKLLSSGAVSRCSTITKLNVFVESFQNRLLVKTFSAYIGDLEHRSFELGNPLPLIAAPPLFFAALIIGGIAVVADSMTVNRAMFDIRFEEVIREALRSSFTCLPSKVEMVTRSDKICANEDTFNIQIRVTCAGSRSANNIRI